MTRVHFLISRVRTMGRFDGASSFETLHSLSESKLFPRQCDIIPSLPLERLLELYTFGALIGFAEFILI